VIADLLERVFQRGESGPVGAFAFAVRLYR
jgi:hypothetical protein